MVTLADMVSHPFSSTISFLAPSTTTSKEDKKMMLRTTTTMFVTFNTLPVQLGLAGVSSMIAASITNPIDVIKTRMQLDGLKMHPSTTTTTTTPRYHKGRYRELLRGMTYVVETEGPGGLYKGLGVSAAREGAYSAIRLGLYEPIKDLLSNELVPTTTTTSGEPLWVKLVAGGLSGSIGVALCNPLDIIKIRLQSDVEGSRYRSGLSGLRSLIKEEGWKGSYLRGLSPNLQRAVLLATAQIPSYDYSKELFVGEGIMNPDGVPLHIAASMVAGLCTALVTSPVDLIKTRMMNQPLPSTTTATTTTTTPIYPNAWSCLVNTVRYEGITSLYRGFFPNFLRLGPHTIVTFVAFEQLRKLMGFHIPKDRLPPPKQHHSS